MVRHRSTSRSFSITARWLAGVGVAVVAVVVVVLVVLALQHARGGDAADSTPRPVPTFTDPTPAETPTPTPTTPPVPAPPGADERFLAVGDGAMWRGTAGQCDGPAPVIERSTDDGETWEDVTPTYRGITQLLSLEPLAGDQAEIIARVGPSCEMQALRTFTYGQFWEPYPDVLAASTYIDPTNPGSVIRPTGAVDAPCASAWGLRSAGDTVGLICDGTAYQLVDGAWQAVGTDAVAIAIVDGEVVMVTSAEAQAPAATAATPEGLLAWSGDTMTTLIR
ncbi:hypothetical protein [Microbacterium sp. CIAB417]|uniref:hypothetical protein n=1 Tax=Microbacterium sp. CIAB417 TaxID=2860287 RepID=UPI001FADEBF9|nr:hypothetical protein [Microbacterium sp. CIAB417]